MTPSVFCMHKKSGEKSPLFFISETLLGEISDKSISQTYEEINIQYRGRCDYRMAGYLPFKKEAPKRLVLRNDMPVATTVFIKNVVEVEIEDSAVVIAPATVPTEVVDDTLEKLEYVENDISAKPSIFRRKKKE